MTREIWVELRKTIRLTAMPSAADIALRKTFFMSAAPAYGLTIKDGGDSYVVTEVAYDIGNNCFIAYTQNESATSGKSADEVRLAWVAKGWEVRS